MEKYQASASAIDNAGLGKVDQYSMFNYDLESALDYHLGARFASLTSGLLGLAEQLDKIGAHGYNEREEIGALYVWLEKETPDTELVVLGFETQTMSFLVYLMLDESHYDIHVRRIWDDWAAKKAAGHYVQGRWDKDKDNGYDAVIRKAGTAVECYSDDLSGVNNPSRPSLLTHQKGEYKLGGSSGLEDGNFNDSGYIASITHCRLANAPKCSSAMHAIRGRADHVFHYIACVI